MIRLASDPIGLEVRWDRLAAATDEAASTMLRTAFSTIIRESTRATGTLQPEDPARVRIHRSAEMRYLGQGFDIEVDLPGEDLGPNAVGRVRTAFGATYGTVLGRSLDGAVEVVNWRLSMRLPDHDLATEGPYARGEDVSRGVRPVHFPGHGLLEATVRNRYELTPGTELAGPAVFEEREASCAFGPECRLRVTDDLTLVVEVGQ